MSSHPPLPCLHVPTLASVSRKFSHSYEIKAGAVRKYLYGNKIAWNVCTGDQTCKAVESLLRTRTSILPLFFNHLCFTRCWLSSAHCGVFQKATRQNHCLLCLYSIQCGAKVRQLLTDMSLSDILHCNPSVQATNTAIFLLVCRPSYVCAYKYIFCSLMVALIGQCVYTV